MSKANSIHVSNYSLASFIQLHFGFHVVEIAIYRNIEIVVFAHLFLASSTNSVLKFYNSLLTCCVTREMERTLASQPLACACRVTSLLSNSMEMNEQIVGRILFDFFMKAKSYSNFGKGKGRDEGFYIFVRVMLDSFQFYFVVCYYGWQMEWRNWNF